MDFSIQILRTGALFALTGGTIMGSVIAGNRIGTLLSDRLYKNDVNSTEADENTEKEIDYEYKYIDEYQSRWEAMQLNEDQDEDEDEEDEEDGERNKQRTAELERKLNGIKIHEITPKGDVIMHYDTKLESFVYYCDDKNIPYKYLETVARKYCLDNDCLEIFVNMYDELKKGIARQTQAKIEKCQNDAKRDEKNEDTHGAKNDVFASFKQYNKTNPKEMIKQRKYITKENANRYSYRGGIATGKQLRIEDPKKKEHVNTKITSVPSEKNSGEDPSCRERSDSTDSAKKSSSKHKKISFSDFKRMQSSTNVDSLPVKTLEEWVESDNESQALFKTDESPTFSPHYDKKPDSDRSSDSIDHGEITMNESDLNDLLGE